MKFWSDGEFSAFAENVYDIKQMYDKDVGDGLFDDETGDWKEISPKKSLTFVYDNDLEEYRNQLPQDAIITNDAKRNQWMVTALIGDWCLVALSPCLFLE